MTKPELLPCPFCGGKAEIWRATANPERPAWIACMGKCVLLVTKEHRTDADAVAAWNRRAAHFLADRMGDALELLRGFVDPGSGPATSYNDGMALARWRIDAARALLRDAGLLPPEGTP